MPSLIFLSVKVLEWVDKGKNRDLAVVFTGYAVSAVFLIFVVNKSYPLDYVDGTLIADPLKMMPDSFLCAGMLCGFLTGWLYGNVHRTVVLHRNLSVSVQKEKIELGGMLKTVQVHMEKRLLQEYIKAVR